MKPIEISLARPEARYASDVLAYSRNEEFFRYLDSAPMQSIDQAEAFLSSLRAANDSGERDYFLIMDSATDTAIGTIGFLFFYPQMHHVADLGYGLSREFWGTNAFQSACRRVLDYGFGTLGLERIQVTTRSDNARAIGGIEKIGFRTEATLRSFYQSGAERVDGVLLCLLRDDFAG